jgi:hypothetical protein
MKRRRAPNQNCSQIGRLLPGIAELLLSRGGRYQYEFSKTRAGVSEVIEAGSSIRKVPSASNTFHSWLCPYAAPCKGAASLDLIRQKHPGNLCNIHPRSSIGPEL